jgi:3-hydroxyethyl bacteriochlorophyllide a dehydrogenase
MCRFSLTFGDVAPLKKKAVVMTQGRETVAIVLEEPGCLSIRRMPLPEPGPDDVVVDVEWSGISTGTERLLWSGKMPPFPGLGYPLVPGYETVGRVVEAGMNSSVAAGERVFVPGAKCFGEVRGLFGGAASRLVVPANRIAPLGVELGEQGVLLALAATAYHAIQVNPCALTDLIVGHGVLGRLIARMTIALGGSPPTVWESNPIRVGGAQGYPVLPPSDDKRRDYGAIVDVSGDSNILDALVQRLKRSGAITLAGFYSAPLSFVFPPAFMREARLLIAAEWAEADLAQVRALIQSGKLSLDGLISHREPADNACAAYATAFEDPHCLKMILDWRAIS